MPQKKKTSVRRSEPKLFKCTGFGNCDMVFTRSEHLARHARKHTGEKPFKCVVPNCDRMFSRFDNMIQHTHTHGRPKKKDSCDSSEGKLSPMSNPEDHGMMQIPSLPSSPSTSIIMTENQHHHLSNKEEKTMYHQPTSFNREEDYVKHKQQFYGYSQSSDSSQQMYYNTPSSPTLIVNSNMMTVSHHNTLYPSKLSPSSVTHTDFFQESQPRHQPCKNSMHNETTLTMSKRRLSYVDLSTPIQELGHNYSTSSSNSSDTTSDEEADENMPSYSQSRFKADGIDITFDEFEALQGFGKFCTEPVVREPILMTRITTSPTCSVSFPIKLPRLRNISPTAAISNSTTSQIHAFRQHISTSHESFSRKSYIN